MTRLPPIAIVGRGCVLPGALSTDDLWKLVSEGRDVVTRVPPGRWGVNEKDAVRPGELPDSDQSWSDRGGYVKGFEEIFDPDGFLIPAETILKLDPLYSWLLHASRDALSSINISCGIGTSRCGAIIGNLSLPTLGTSQFAEGVWRGLSKGNPYNRFVSALPAHLLAKALGLGGGVFALDAACASSLFAIKLACDRLHDGTADLMIAGGVNGADDLFIHVGFSALGGLSRSGQSRPFHREADGLVPAEGAAVVVLERLDDALRAGHHILGLIRGIGISNDGRERTFVTPSVEGQVRAMQLAYETSGIAPDQISLIECHATGTQIGDGIEIQSLSRLYEDNKDVPIGSLKSNMGHLITAAGVAGLLKVLGAMEAGVRPPTLHVSDPISELHNSPFRLLHKSEAWEVSGPRRAAVSAFGFGGNNAHLVLEEWLGQTFNEKPGTANRSRVAVVGLGARVAGGQGIEDFAKSILSRTSQLGVSADGSRAGRAEKISVAMEGLKFPPRDLQEILPQQLLMLEAAREAIAKTQSLPRQRTAVYVGMGCDAEIARYTARWRVPNWTNTFSPETVQTIQDAFHTPIVAAGVIGVLANMPANRISSQFDIKGASFTISAMEASGIVALELASRALQAGEIDVAIVGAVDLSCEPVHEAALKALGKHKIPGDGAVALVLRRLEDAQQDGDDVLAVLGKSDSSCFESDDLDLVNLVGEPHAAIGLMRVVSAVLRCQSSARLKNYIVGKRDNQVSAGIQVVTETLEGPSYNVWVENYNNSFPDVDATDPYCTPNRMLNFPAHWPEVRLPLPKFSRQDLEYLATGRISKLFGEAFEQQDVYERQVRIPEPPLLLTDRVISINAVPGSMTTGSICTETDISEDAWYLHAGRMPAGIMIESGQADLLLISWLGVDWHNRGERVYRLLGCEVIFHGPLPKPGDCLSYEIYIDSHARNDAMHLFFFHSDCRIDGKLRLSVRSGQAGFFTDAELASSHGVLWDPIKNRCQSNKPIATPQINNNRLSYDAKALQAYAAGDLIKCFGSSFSNAVSHLRTPRIQAGRMQLIDCVERCEANGGPWGRGYLKAKLSITAESWFFSGHFKNDPCMPGTLMFEGCLQCMAFYITAQGFTLDRDGWLFEPVIGENIKMRCRGQVIPDSRELIYEVFVEDMFIIDDTPVLYADVLCSVDGLKAFHASRVGLKLVPDSVIKRLDINITINQQQSQSETKSSYETEDTIDLVSAPWLGDHRPIYSLPTVPLACMTEWMAAAALKHYPGNSIIGLRDVHAKRWMIVSERPTRIKTQVKRLSETSAEVTLMVWRDAATPKLSRFEPAASAVVNFSTGYPPQPQHLFSPEGLSETENPYRAHTSFHGPAFQRIRQLSMSSSASRGNYDATPGVIPHGVLAPVLLDAALHVLPNDQPSKWCSEVGPECVAYPSRFEEVNIYGSTPTTGEIICSARFAGYDGERQISFELELKADSQVWMRLRLISRIFQIGSLNRAGPLKRKAFLERCFVPGMGLSRHSGEKTYLNENDVQQLDFLPGTVAHVYALSGEKSNKTIEVAVKEHIAWQAKVHPSEVFCKINGNRFSATLLSHPGINYVVEVTREQNDLVIENVKVNQAGDVGM